MELPLKLLLNPKGIVSSSPGVAVAAYLGKNAAQSTTPKVVVARMGAMNLMGAKTAFRVAPACASHPG
jgi:hypothetical protein